MMTVSEALAAHASAQMATARATDEARRVGVDAELIPNRVERRSFIESWAINATVIGQSRALES